MSLNNELKSLIQKSLLLKPELKKRLMGEFPNMTLKKKEEIYNLINDAEKAKNGILRAVLSDPEKRSKLKQFIHKQKRQRVHDKEQGENQKEEKLLYNLEQQIDGLDV